MRTKRWLLSLIIAFIIACVGVTTIGVSETQAALVFHSGFETGDLGEWNSIVGSPAAVETQKKTGDYAMQCDTTGGAATAYVDASATSYRISFYLYIATAPDGECKLTNTGTSGIRLTTDRYIKLYNSDVDKGTSDTQLALDTWYRISQTTKATGDLSTTIWINGNQEINVAEGITPSDGIGIHSAVTADLYFDDVVIDDIFTLTTDLGDIRVLRAVPTVDGFHCDWKNESDIACSTADCFESVDEVPAATADYVWFEANGVLNQQTWTTTNMTTLGVDGMTPNAISSWFYYTTGGGGATEYYTYMRDDGTDYSTALPDDPKIPTWVSRYDAVMPNGGGVWTEARVDAYEIGMATDDAGKDIWCYTAYKMIAYTHSAVGEADISNAPGSKAFGTVKMSTSYWSNGSAPTWPLDDSECYFTVTNSGNTCSITIKGTNFTGGVGWTLAGSPGTDIVTLKAAPSGTDLAANMTTLTTSEQSFISGLGINSTKKWEMSMETPTLYGDAVLKESTITLAATLD